jgi:hypothetical protein
MVGILYYFFPIWTIIRPDGQFLFSEFETRILPHVETPPASFLLTDPLLRMLGGAHLLRLPRLARERLLDLHAVAGLLIGLLMPVVLVLMFDGMAFRYRMEFYPFLEFTAFLGFYAICVDPDQSSALLRGRLSLFLIASAGFGIVCSHLLLFLSKISPNVWITSAPDGWVTLYLEQLKAIFPVIAQRLHV